MKDRVAEHRDHQREEQAHLGFGAGGQIEMPEEEDEQQQGKNADQSEDDRGGPAEVEHSFQNTPRRPPALKTRAAYTHRRHASDGHRSPGRFRRHARAGRGGADARSEEHTSELQSQSKIVCRLLLEKKKKKLKRPLLYRLSYQPKKLALYSFAPMKRLQAFAKRD